MGNKLPQAGDRACDLGAPIVASQIQEAPPALPKRRGRPKKLPKQVAAVVALRLEGYNNTQICRALGLRSTRDVTRLIYRAKQLGGFDDVLDRVDGIAVPTAVENLITGLQEGDKDYTLETLKGRGVFRNHSQVKSDGGGGGGNTLVVKFEMPVLPAGVMVPQVGEGQIVGVPRMVGGGTTIPALPPAPDVEVIDAVQVPSTTSLDAPAQARDGEAVGGGDSGPREAAPARRQPDYADLDTIADQFARRG